MNENIFSFVRNLDIKKEEATISICGTLDETLLKTNSLIYVKYGNLYYELTPQMINGRNGFYGILHNESITEGDLYQINGSKIYMQHFTF